VFFLDFSLYRTLLMPTEPISASVGVNVPSLTVGRFSGDPHWPVWVTPEAPANRLGQADLEIAGKDACARSAKKRSLKFI
jgi:hypothetical protein